MEADRLVVGRIVKAHGIRGEVVVDVISDAPDRFAAGAALLAGDRALMIETVRAHQGRLLVRFAQVPDRTTAESLRGTVLTIEAGDARALPEDAWYPHQLEGLAVVTPDATMLGVFARVEESPAHDVWVVRTEHGEVLVPAVREVVCEVDLAGGRIVIDPPEGLF